MKRAIASLAALLLALCLPASAEVIADGAVECGTAVVQLAAMGGTVAEVVAQPGDYVRAGDAIATLGLTRVYAPCAGTVEKIFAGTGESAGDASGRYGGAVVLAPENRYTVYATSEDAYKSARASHIAPGQTVYMKCTRDGTHRGTGVVNEIDGEIFFVEATGGEFYNGETVYLYMEDDYDSQDRLGKGTVVATQAQAVPAEGDVAALYVREGDFVEKGQLLLETLGALPEDGDAPEGLALTAEAEGYVKALYAEANGAVERGGLLAEICPADGLVAAVKVGAADVASVSVGDSAVVSIELPEETLRLDGAVASVSYLPDDGGDYAVRVRFDADTRVFPGLAATVTIR